MRTGVFRPFESHFGGLGPNDGTVDFYLRVGSLASPDKTLLDLGAGRAAWHEDDTVAIRRGMRTMRGRFGQVIAADIDPVVLNNRASERQVLIEDGRLPLDDGSVDVIVSDYVLEHVADPAGFAAEVDRLLAPGGWFCARTPHRWNYVVLASRAMNGRLGDRMVSAAQPDRKDEDVFPKTCRMNSMRDLEAAFSSYRNHSYLRRADPAYYFGSRHVYRTLDFIHRVMPAAFSGNIFVFLQKPEG